MGVWIEKLVLYTYWCVSQGLTHTSTVREPKFNKDIRGGRKVGHGQQYSGNFRLGKLPESWIQFSSTASEAVLSEANFEVGPRTLPISLTSTDYSD